MPGDQLIGLVVDDEPRHLIEPEVDEERLTPTESAPSDLDSDVDSILDEIDSVLESNAEDFVKAFVQKGGQ